MNHPFTKDSGSYAWRYQGNPVAERKEALRAWQECGYRAVIAGRRPTPTETVRKLAGDEAVVMYRRGLRLGREEVERRQG